MSDSGMGGGEQGHCGVTGRTIGRKEKQAVREMNGETDNGRSLKVGRGEGGGDGQAGRRARRKEAGG
ncbi:hypothetical protein B1218_34625 [Pseudomonas ogarae]|nr:hypothetical protein B1218_34625 [Pseudomonas ogarae]